MDQLITICTDLNKMMVVQSWVDIMFPGFEVASEQQTWRGEVSTKSGISKANKGLKVSKTDSKF
jgi:hypothetical protein